MVALTQDPSNSVQDVWRPALGQREQAGLRALGGLYRRRRRVFFFQAEDGIRDPLVTGVQTCALPISTPTARPRRASCRSRCGTSAADSSRASARVRWSPGSPSIPGRSTRTSTEPTIGDRKSTRLNSSHEWISYAVFCLKKKKKQKKTE